jgi:hypothetical protein
MPADEPFDIRALEEACGASAPAIAAIAEQGLVAFLGISAEEARCPASAPVFGLGLYVGQGGRSKDFFWSNPTNDGIPEVIGNTSGGAPPAVAAVSDEGFVVGFGGESGALELLWVPRQPLPSNNDGLTCGKEDPLCDDRDGLSTARLRGIQALGSLGNLGRFDGVQVAVQELTEGFFALAVTWVDGCVRQPDGALQGFAQILQLEASSAAVRATPVGETLELGQVAGPPLPVPSNGAFVSPGFSRPSRDSDQPPVEQPTFEEPALGQGFFIVTPGKNGKAVRVLSFDGAPLDTNEEISIPGPARAPLTSSDPGSFFSFDESAGSVVRATFSCEE